MIPTVFILAAGEAHRFGGIVKQNLPFRGEPIIRRTIRQIRETNPDIPIYIITWRKELVFQDTLTINTQKKTPSVSASILFSESYWDQVNIFLTGDTIYYEDTLKDILNIENYYMAGKLKPIFKDHTERYAYIFTKEDHDKVCEMCIAAYDIPGLSGLVSAHYPMIYWNVPGIFRPFKDYLVYHVIPKRYRSLSTHFEITDATDDIDTPEEYQRYLRSFE